MTRQRIGQRGEDLAAQYLQSQGYTIVARNWRCQYGELDLVARHTDTLVFVEVKTRQSYNLKAGMEQAFAGITPHKREKVIKAVYAYLEDHNHSADTLWRVDAIGVTLTYDNRVKIDHVEDAFDW